MSVECRILDPSELRRVREIDRTEQIDALYVQDGAGLELTYGDWSAPGWAVDGDDEHSLAGQQAFLEGLVGDGAVALGAFEGERLVGIGAVLPSLRRGVAQLAYLQVSAGRRERGVGGMLAETLERIAREAGATSVVVSATPSANTVDFYRRRGYEPMAEPLPELLEREPDDVHLAKSL